MSARLSRPQSTRPERMLITEQHQRNLGFTNHALERFAERAGITAHSWRALESVLRDLLYQEGRVVPERPHWARSQNTADAYIQVGEWLLLICRHDELRRGALTVVTSVNGPEGNTWSRALEAGYIETPMPQVLSTPRLQHTSLWESIKIARDCRGPGQPHFVGRVRRTHSARRAEAQDAYETLLHKYHKAVRAYEARRARAREHHIQRYGNS